MTVPMCIEDLFAAIVQSPVAPLLSRDGCGDEITQRSILLEHSVPELMCQFCGDGARMALYVGPSDLYGQPRWLDTCYRCYSALRAMNAIWIPDEEIIYAFENWQKRNSQNP
jgi:hypothetical protein